MRKVDSSWRLPEIELPENDTSDLIIGRDIWSKEDLPTSSTENGSVQDIDSLDLDTDTDDIKTAKDDILGLTEK